MGVCVRVCLYVYVISQAHSHIFETKIRHHRVGALHMGIETKYLSRIAQCRVKHDVESTQIEFDIILPFGMFSSFEWENIQHLFTHFR